MGVDEKGLCVLTISIVKIQIPIVDTDFNVDVEQVQLHKVRADNFVSQRVQSVTRENSIMHC